MNALRRALSPGLALLVTRRLGPDLAFEAHSAHHVFGSPLQRVLVTYFDGAPGGETLPLMEPRLLAR